LVVVTSIFNKSPASSTKTREFPSHPPKKSKYSSALILAAGITTCEPTPAGEIETVAVVEEALLLLTSIDFTMAVVAAGTVKTVANEPFVSDVKNLLYEFDKV
jgi:hypothetical protein